MNRRQTLFWTVELQAFTETCEPSSNFVLDHNTMNAIVNQTISGVVLP